MADATRPTHCPDDLDERGWVAEGECGEQYHRLVAEAQLAASAWVRAVTSALPTSRIGLINLPESTGASKNANGRVVDPSLFFVVIARARRDDKPADALYIGIVTQTPTALWRGVTGFYLPYCSQCHPDPMTTVQVVLTWLPEDARVQAPNRLPFAIRPAPGWFDGRMLLAAHLARPAAWHGSSIWKLWPHSGAPDSAPALVCVGPMGPDLSNLLFLHDAKRDLPELRRVLLQWSPELPNDLALPYRTGTADELQALAGGICSAPPPRGLVVKLIPGGLTRAQAPIAWGGYAIEEPGCPVSIGVTRNMREALRDARAHGLLHDGKSQATLYHWPVREGVIAFRDLRRLGTWLSTSKGGAGSSRLGE